MFDRRTNRKFGPRKQPGNCLSKNMSRRMTEDVSTFISIRSDDCDLLTITQARSEVGFDTVN